MPLMLSILRILESYLSIRAARAKWELERDIESYCDNVQNQIIEARERGDDARADVLRERLTSSSGIAPTRRDFEAVPRADVHRAGK